MGMLGYNQTPNRRGVETVSEIFAREDGTVTTSDDPARTMWYSARCGYWTDDWSKLIRVGPGIPACPKCKMVGMQSTMGDWLTGAHSYANENPGYYEFLLAHKEKCYWHYPRGLLDVWDMTKDQPQMMKSFLERQDGTRLAEEGPR